MKKIVHACWVLLPLFILTTASTAQNLSGPLSGTLGPGSYTVVGNCYVYSGYTLTIRPGTTFTHNGNYNWTIYGHLTADGTADSLIRFTGQTSDSTRMWRGLRFYNSSASSSLLDYCLVEYAYNPSDSGGGIYCSNAAINVTHSTIAYCSALGGGGGIYAVSSPILVEDSQIHHNTALTAGAITGNGGGIYLMYSGLAHVRRSYVHHNGSTGA